jgi:hypothetical protein
VLEDELLDDEFPDDELPEEPDESEDVLDVEADDELEPPVFEPDARESVR